MNLEDQVCSLELSIRLKELGVNQNSSFYWFEGYDCWLLHYVDYNHHETDSKIFMDNFLCYSAFIASELSEILPNTITMKENEPFNNYRICLSKFHSVEDDGKLTNNYIINYECDSTEMHGQNAWLRRRLTNNIYDPNLANAMAKMIIYLIENGLLKND